MFDFPGINKGNARFDERKLTALNAEYLRELDIGSFCFLARPRLAEAGLAGEDVSEDYLQAVLALCQPKARSLDTLDDLCGYFFSEAFPVDEKAAAKLAKKGDPKAAVAGLLPVLEPLESFDADALQSALESFAVARGEKPFAYFPALRMAVSGKGGGPDLLPMLAVLGRERVLQRLRSYCG